MLIPSYLEWSRARLELRESKAAVIKHNALQRFTTKKNVGSDDAKENLAIDSDDDEIAADEYTNSQAAVYERFLNEAHVSRLYPNLVPLVQLMLVQPPTTAGCERMFSFMNLIKNPRRNRLLPATLNSLLMLAEHSNAVNIREVVEKWVSQRKKAARRG